MLTITIATEIKSQGNPPPIHNELARLLQCVVVSLNNRTFAAGETIKLRDRDGNEVGSAVWTPTA